MKSITYWKDDTTQLSFVSVNTFSFEKRMHRDMLATSSFYTNGEDTKYHSLLNLCVSFISIIPRHMYELEEFWTTGTFFHRYLFFHRMLHKYLEEQTIHRTERKSSSGAVVQ